MRLQEVPAGEGGFAVVLAKSFVNLCNKGWLGCLPYVKKIKSCIHDVSIPIFYILPLLGTEAIVILNTCLGIKYFSKLSS